MEFDPWYPIKAYKEISKWIIKFHSQKRCPNPCFRLELFKFMIDLDCSGKSDLKLFRKKAIITLFELCDNYKSLTLKQLPKFDPEDLKAILFKGIKQMYKCTLIFQKKKVQKKKNKKKKYFKVNICFSFTAYINFFMGLLVT